MTCHTTIVKKIDISLKLVNRGCVTYFSLAQMSFEAVPLQSEVGRPITMISLYAERIKTKVTMTDSYRLTFETKGYLSIENALSSDELHTLNAALDREFSNRRDTFYSRSD